uniref:HD domain-containing protein n=1 Tax=Chlamydomonas euryale TaxID=1486919 RepID=A0A7R9V3G7_9CHLO|mmetsp:Transcript_17515/g.52664  ORF Transcript_17515/g.52664 Transcript_17515/m.52664 type:complete len:238 (+) Transcript_17515:205-918(+)
MTMTGKQMRALFALGTIFAVAVGVAFYQEGHAEHKGEITIITTSPVVEEHLSPFKDVIGQDYEAYRNHVYRVLTFALHFLGNLNHSDRRHIELALAYHDLGLWTDDDSLAYIEPSLKRAGEAASAEGWSEEAIQLVKNIVYWHHKVTAFEGPHADAVNAVRRADTVDFSMGIINHGMPWTHILNVYDGIKEKDTDVVIQEGLPSAGFHKMLMYLPLKRYGWKQLHQGIREIVTIFKW